MSSYHFNDTDAWFDEADLLEEMEDFYFDPEEVYSDVYDFPELLVPLEEYQGEL